MAEDNPIPAACYAIADGAQLVVQSIGADRSRLCPSTSPFSQFLSALSSCVSAHTGDANVTRAPPTIIASAEAYCNSTSIVDLNRGLFPFPNYTTVTIQLTDSIVSESVSSDSILSVCCNIPQRLQLTFDCAAKAVSTVQCARYTTSAITATTSKPDGSAIPTSASESASTSSSKSTSTTSLIVSTGTPTPSPNVGLIAGAAVGATLGFVLVVALIGCCIWRRRKQRKAKRAAAAIQNHEPEKAQLHSDDIKPKELEGPRVIPVRSVGGLEEMDGSNVAKSRFRVGEMPANEGVGSEMTSDGTTIRGSEISRGT